MEILLLLITFSFLVISLKKAPFLPFPTVFLFILFASQLAFVLVHEGLIKNDFYGLINLGGLKNHYLYGNFVYTFLAFFSTLSMLGVSKHITFQKVREQIQTQLSKKERNRTVSLGIFLFSFFQLTAYLLLSDWGKIWFHKTYLESPIDMFMAEIIGFSASSFIYNLNTFSFVLSSIGYFLSKELKQTFLKTGLFCISFFYYIILFSFHSRFATAYPFFLILFTLISESKHKTMKVFFLLFLCFFTMVCALNGRALPEQGLSSIPATVQQFFSIDLSDNVETVLLNITEGIFETTEALQMRVEYPTAYKVLVFSPLPSFIDGYDVLKEAHQVRLHDFVPMPGLAEVLLFNGGYWVLLVVLYTVFIRTHLTLAKRNVFVFILCNFLILFSAYHFLAYPTRNALHIAWFSFAITLLARFLPLSHTKTNPKPLLKIMGE